MKITAIRVRLRVRRATITEGYDFRYGETIGPLTPGLTFVRWDGGEGVYIDAALLEECPWKEGRS